MANVSLVNDELVAVLTIDEFISGNLTPRTRATSGGAVIAYFVYDRLMKTKYADIVEKFETIVTTSNEKGEIIVVLKNISAPLTTEPVGV